MYDQSPKDPFMLDCLVCAEEPATLISVEGVFHCAKCAIYDTPTINPDDYCISCGVDSRMMGKQICYWCYDADEGTDTYAGLWSQTGPTHYTPPAPVEEELELIQAVR